MGNLSINHLLLQQHLNNKEDSPKRLELIRVIVYSIMILYSIVVEVHTWGLGIDQERISVRDVIGNRIRSVILL